MIQENTTFTKIYIKLSRIML